MSYILFVCIGLNTWTGTCARSITVKTQTQSQCNAEREALIRYPSVSYALCSVEEKKS